MDTVQLKVFLEVVKQGSFAAAARRLELDPSAVTRAIAALEATLQARLFNRTTRRLALTEAGTAFFEQAAPALEQLERAADEARSSNQATGLVRITMSAGFGQHVLLPLLPELHRLHPGIEIELQLTEAVLDLVKGETDIALRLGSSADGSLVGLPLRPMRYRVYASPAYLKANGRPRVPADLAICDCLRFAQSAYRDVWTFRDPQGSAEAVSVKGWLSATTALALHRAALDGLGPVMLADLLVQEDAARGRLVDLFPQHEVSAGELPTSVWLLYASRSFVPRRVRAVVDFLRERLGQ
ncbi:LysR family transcriptional regulator [Niveibacterium sp. SC-1]|uniref:LysR family transcriptional regulator n=1 Tax=Niveibacterium sp. SC-1 TaxID=3135646 RepID=UPI00311F30FA